MGNPTDEFVNTGTIARVNAGMPDITLETTTGNNTSSVTGVVVLTPVYDLAVINVLSAGYPRTIYSGDVMSFDVTIHNFGNQTATGYTITYTYPAGLNFI
jgi:uncharacterized repeat protein (TIGR01451 family)